LFFCSKNKKKGKGKEEKEKQKKKKTAPSPPSSPWKTFLLHPLPLTLAPASVAVLAVIDANHFLDATIPRAFRRGAWGDLGLGMATSVRMLDRRAHCCM
jgi:hypothetical protein